MRGDGPLGPLLQRRPGVFLPVPRRRPPATCLAPRRLWPRAGTRSVPPPWPCWPAPAAPPSLSSPPESWLGHAQTPPHSVGGVDRTTKTLRLLSADGGGTAETERETRPARRLGRGHKARRRGREHNGAAHTPLPRARPTPTREVWSERRRPCRERGGGGRWRRQPAGGGDSGSRREAVVDGGARRVRQPAGAGDRRRPRRRRAAATAVAARSGWRR